MNPQLFLSIVTISFNQAGFLRQCIDSVLAQKDEDVEYIVIDPGSTDGSREILKSYGDAIDCLVLEKDKGPSDGLNKCFARATGQIGYFINSDDFMLPGAIDRLRALWGENEHADVLLCGAWKINGDGEPLNEMRAMPLTLDNLVSGRFPLVQQGVSFKMERFQQAGGFNVNNRTCWDLELLWAMVRDGAVVRAFRYRIGVFRIHAESISGGVGGEALAQQYYADLDRIHETMTGGPRKAHWLGNGQLSRLEKYFKSPRLAAGVLQDRLFPSAMRRRYRQDLPRGVRTSPMIRVAFCWFGLPEYATRCIRVMIARSDNPVPVIATRPSVPIENLELSLGQPIHWIDGQNANLSWNRLGLERPDVLFLGGYFVPAFNALAADCRARGGNVVLNSDANWRGTLIQRTIEPVRHKLKFQKKFDGLLVPGASGQRFARKMGYSPDAVLTGLLGADPALFYGGSALTERPKKFLFVGQFIERKNILGLAKAFVRFAANHSDWTLSLCGSGDQRDYIPKHSQIFIHEFVQSPQLAEIMRESRCLVLPSLEEHWGLVVHEAASTGCALALTETVGAADDLARPDNAVILKPNDTGAIERALHEIAGWDDTRWLLAEHVSRALAKKFGPEQFAEAVERLATLIIGRKVR